MSDVKILGPELGYVDMLDVLTEDYIKEQRESGNDTNKTPLRPSAAGKCSRELYYELMEYLKKARYEKDLYGAETHRIFSLGHSIEYHIIKEMEARLKNLFEIRYKQQSLSFAWLEAKNNPEHSQWLEGSTDLVFWSKQHKCIADVKSKKMKYSSYRDSDWHEFNDKLSRMKSVVKVTEKFYYVDNLREFLKEVRDPFLAMNFYQLNLYARNPFMVERNIDHASIIQYAKNTSELREIRFKPCQELYEETIAKFQRVLTAVDEDKIELATKDHQLGSMKCAFCSFRKECWPDNDPLKTYFRSLPPKRWPKSTAKLGDLGIALDTLYEKYLEAQEGAQNLSSVENEIIELLIGDEENKIDKVQFFNGDVYEVKLYKSPKEHFQLKRSKL